MESTENMIISEEMDLAPTTILRNNSVGSSDSFDSDGQFCTEDYCTMDDKRINKRNGNVLNDEERNVERRDSISSQSSSTESSRNDYTLTNRKFLNKKSECSQKDSYNPINKVNNATRKVFSGKLCRICGGEMLRDITDSELEEDIAKPGPFHKRYQKLTRRLSGIMPDWMSEPEYMVHPKPRVNRSIVHSHADSLFSTSSGFTNYYGILNLCLILLVLSNARLFLENIMKYGILFNVGFLRYLFDEPYSWPNLFLTLGIGISPVIALLTEKAIARGYISDKVGLFVYAVNLATLLLVPAGVIYLLHPVIVFSIFTLGSVSLVFLKMISYAQTNGWCRECYADNKRKRRRSEGPGSEGSNVANDDSDGLQVYPDNLNVKDMTYFIFAPTLCYELNFPRSARIRKRFLVKRMLEMVCVFWLMVSLIQQWIVPAVANSRKPLAEMQFFNSLERLLRLAIPNHFIWLLFFYWLFHSTLNVVAELLRFGDRTFYRDWWNAETVNEFWQLWNIPVHRWAHRHIYKPLLRRGMSRMPASILVFCLSAFFHEFLVSVPLRMFKIWAFSGMLMQIPIAYITARFVQGKWGNIIMWLSVILGQPVAILAYFHDYYIVYSLPFKIHEDIPS